MSIEMSMSLTVREKALILESLPGMLIPFDAMKVARKFNAENKCRVDWHEFSDYLDQLHTKKLLQVMGSNRDGMIQYKLAEVMIAEGTK